MRPDEAKRAARELGAPVVVKASGLAAGQGRDRLRDDRRRRCAPSTPCSETTSSARRGARCWWRSSWRARSCRSSRSRTARRVLPMLPAQDHKRLLDGDRGPNTGGMGAYAPRVAGLRPASWTTHRSRVRADAATHCATAGAPFSGLLYAGLMLTAQGAQGGRVQLLASAIRKRRRSCRCWRAAARAVCWRSRAVAGSTEQPLRLDATPRRNHRSGCRRLSRQAAQRGPPSDLPPRPSRTCTFSTPERPCDATGELVTAGGRVFAVTAVAPTLDAAQQRERARGRRDRARREAAPRATSAGGSSSAVPELPETETIARDLDRARHRRHNRRRRRFARPTCFVT